MPCCRSSWSRSSPPAHAETVALATSTFHDPGGKGIPAADLTTQTLVVAAAAGEANRLAVSLRLGALEIRDDVLTLTFFGTLRGGPGTDTLSGSPGRDLLDGGTGSDTLDGAAGADTLSYFGRPDGVTVDLGAPVAGAVGEDDHIAGFEAATGGEGPDVLRAVAVGSELTGGGGDDVLEGGPGDDVLFGDRLSGGPGDDRLAGPRTGAAAAALDCGPGRDTLLRPADRVLLPGGCERVLAGVDDHEVGSASGVLNAMQQLGGAAGIAVLGTVFFSVAETSGMAEAFQRILWVEAGTLLVVAALVCLLPLRARETET